MREVFDRRLYGYLDGPLLVAIFVLSSIGLLMIYSATFDPTLQNAGPQVLRQFWALVLGILGLVVLLMFDYRTLLNHSGLLYVGLISLLIYTLFFGVERGGAQRWIDFGFINLQVSEFARLVIALTLAAFYSDQRRENRSFLDWALGALIISVPFVLIVREPDLGTAITLLPVAVIIMIFAGLKLKFLMSLCMVGILLTPLAWTYALEDYQKLRIASFVDPEQDPYGAGYQQIQARITVGSGGLEGKGFLEGTQNQYNFLPVAHNDFIFSVLAEEQGFLGVLVVLGLYLFVIMRSLEAARLAKDRQGMLLVVGIVGGFVFQVVYNVTMSAGLAPVKGLTLPLMSYGGSSIIATLLGFGLILNVRMRRFTN